MMNRKSLLTAALPLVLAAGPACFAAAETDYSTTVLDAVVVTASRSQESLREVTSNVTLIDSAQIKASTANSMEELMAQNGFFVSSQGTTKLVQIRGMSQPSMGHEMQSPVLVLFNGRRIGANNVGLMGLANVERVEIIRGPSAVQYGPSAMGGVINIITKRAGENGFNAELEGGLGSFGLHKESLAVNGGAGGFDFALGAVNYGRQSYEAHGGAKMPKSSVDYSTNANLDLGYSFNEANRIGANINYYGFQGKSGPTYSTRSTYTDWNDYNLDNYNVAFMYDGGIVNRMFNWSASYSFGQNESKGKHYSSAWGDSKSGTTIDVQNGNAQAGYNGDMVSADLGVDYVQYDYKSFSSYSDSKGDYKDLGVYLAAKVKLLDQKLIFSLGGRYDHYKTNNNYTGKGGKDDNFSPSVGIAVLPVSWLKLRANYAEGFKMATPDQMGGGGNYIANTGLKPEKSKTWEAGADVSWQFVDAGLTYFYTDWKDKIVSRQVASSQWQYTNIKGAQLSGIEFALSADIGRALSWQSEIRPYVNFTYMLDRKNKDKDSAGYYNPYMKNVPNVPQWMVNFGLTFSNMEHDLKANVNAVYTGSISTYDYRHGGMYDPPLVTKHTGGMVVNASVEKGLFNLNEYGSVKLRVDVNNIFDADNEAYLDYPGPGRNFYVGLKYVF